VNTNTSRLRPSGRRIRQRSQSRSLRSLFSSCAATCAACGGGLDLIISGPPLHRNIWSGPSAANRRRREPYGTPQQAAKPRSTRDEGRTVHPKPLVWVRTEKTTRSRNGVATTAFFPPQRSRGDLRLGAWTLYSAFSWSTRSHLSQIYAMMRSPRSWMQTASEAKLPWIIAHRS
jgi:hypothetical protein